MTRHIDEASIYRAILDSIPVPLLVVDDDVRIQEYNAAAAPLLAEPRQAVLRRRGGEALHCLHARESPDGCGRGPFCPDCLIRNAVSLALKGTPVSRQRHKLELLRGDTEKKIYALITCTSIPFAGERRVLLAIEDINELVELRQLIPICARCKKIRNEKDYWVMVEEYFQQHLDVDFTHGMCPECVQATIEESNHDPMGTK